MIDRSIDKETLSFLYTTSGLSMQQIATQYGCSLHRIDYWMRKHDIPKRTRADAVYMRLHPQGDPFCIKKNLLPSEQVLWGMGIGLYWGEGTKANLNAVRLGNSDPGVILMFIRFLTELCGVGKDDLRFGLQIFTDIDTNEALHYWTTKLSVRESQFYKIMVTPSGSIGTYRKKNQYGVITLYYNNTRLRDILVKHINDMPR